MDSVGYKQFCFIFVFLTFFTSNDSYNTDRDIILTPHLSRQYAGKILYFNPIDEDDEESTVGRVTPTAISTSKSTATEIEIEKAAIQARTPMRITVKDKENRTIINEEEVSTTLATTAIMTTPTMVPEWEAALRHATYLVLNNKLDGNFNSSDIISKQILKRAMYQKRGNQRIDGRFGDIIPLANGWVERIDGRDQYQFIEMDYHQCKLNCSFDEALKRNVSAFWLVEKIRHRDMDRGLRYELRFTIFPVRKLKYENKRDANIKSTTKPKSFIVRDDDYPHLFPRKRKMEENRIQKRIFDLGTQFNHRPTYEEQQIPFDVNTYRQQKPFQFLNTGEYFVNGHNPQFSYPADVNHLPNHVPFQQSNEFLPYVKPTRMQIDSQIRFPSPEATSKIFQGQLPSYSSNPLTTTHLHHHYYLNKNNVPIGKMSAYEKENIYGNPLQTFVPSVQVYKTEQTNSVRDTPEKVNEPYKVKEEQPTGHEDIRNYQTPFALTEQIPIPPPTMNHLYHQLPIMYPFHIPLTTPSVSQIFHQLIPHTVQSIPQSPPQPPSSPPPPPPLPTQSQQPPTAQLMELVNINQHHPHHILAPIIDLHPRYISRPIVVNELSPNTEQEQFKPNLQFENHKYSEPDPLYKNQPILVTPVPNTSFTFDLTDAIQPPSAPQQVDSQNENSVSPRERPYGKRILKKTKGIYRIPPTSTRTTTTEFPAEHGIPNEPPPDYPDSINAQLPPPDNNEDLTVPYVESSIVTERQPVLTIASPKSQTQYQSEDQQPDTKHPATVRLPGFIEKPKRGRHRAFYPKTTTEKPILKWMPKRNRFTEPTTTSTTTGLPESLTSTSEAVYTVTPVSVDYYEEPRTSISTSISIRVGPKQNTNDTSVIISTSNGRSSALSVESESNVVSVDDERADSLSGDLLIRKSPENDGLIETTASTVLEFNENGTTTTASTETIAVTSTTTSKATNTITTTESIIVPSGVETIKGHLQRIPTNSSDLRLFQATEDRKGTVDNRIAASIVEHARRLH